ncbi:ribonuclease T2-like [Blyttiomyces sp. JEL0837]|nr:ribonuclease T2-like [Blyttiomyces sp. JEL0837]
MFTKIAVIAAVAGLASAAYCPVNNGLYCPPNAVACKADPVTGGLYDGCCVGQNGLVVLSQNWTFGYKYDAANVVGGKHENWFNFTYQKTAPSNAWTIHGLWPDNCDGTYNSSAFGCDPARIYEDVESRLVAANPSFLSQIQKLWIGADGNTNWFWSHEWTKHATCFSVVHPSCYGSAYTKDIDVVDFFRATLKLTQDYAVYDVLANAGIVPSENVTYTIPQMNAAFNKTLGGNIPAFQCVKDSKGNQYVTEAWTYFWSTPGLNFVPASTANKAAIGYFSGCNATAPVYYLPNLY